MAEKTYSAPALCMNCGHMATYTFPFGITPRDSETPCNNCGIAALDSATEYNLQQMQDARARLGGEDL